jgi:hypothetical protein
VRTVAPGDRRSSWCAPRPPRASGWTRRQSRDGSKRSAARRRPLLDDVLLRHATRARRPAQPTRCASRAATLARAATTSRRVASLDYPGVVGSGDRRPRVHAAGGVRGRPDGRRNGRLGGVYRDLLAAASAGRPRAPRVQLVRRRPSTPAQEPSSALNLGRIHCPWAVQHGLRTHAATGDVGDRHPRTKRFTAA